jgi:hypothetical protein
VSPQPLRTAGAQLKHVDPSQVHDASTPAIDPNTHIGAFEGSACFLWLVCSFRRHSQLCLTDPHTLVLLPAVSRAYAQARTRTRRC